LSREVIGNWLHPNRVPRSILRRLEDPLYGLNVFDTKKFLLNFKRISLASCAVLSGLLATVLAVLNLKILLPLAVVPVLIYPLLWSFLVQAYVNFKANVKREYIDRDFYILLLYLHSLCSIGLSAYRAIEEVLRFNLHKHLKEELSKIVMMVRYEGLPVRLALLKVATTTPSSLLSDFLRGLASVIEANETPLTYISDKLTLLNVERRVYLREYLEKLNIVTGLYLTMITIGTVGVLVGAVTKCIPQKIILMAIYSTPVITVIFGIITSTYNPEKEIPKPYSRITPWLIALIFAVLFASVLLNQIGIDVRFYALLATAVISALILVKVEKQIAHESEIERAIPAMVTRLITLSETQSFTQALLISSEVEESGLKRYLKRIAWDIYTGRPLSEAIREHICEKAPSFILRVFGTVLAHISPFVSKVSDVLLNLTQEFHRYMEYKRQRQSIVRTVGMTILIAFFLSLGLSVLINSYYLPALTGLSSKGSKEAVPTPTLGQFQTDAKFAHEQIVNMILLLSATVPLGITTVDGDYRKYFRLYLVCSVLSLVTVYIIVNNISLWRGIL